MPTDSAQSETSGPGGSGTELLACVSCRARKLKCDRVTPACARCVKISAECVYPESRRKPTFKRRNVKELEARLAQVEDYLKDANRAAEIKAGASGASLRDGVDAQSTADFQFSSGPSDSGDGSRNTSNPPHDASSVPTGDWQQEPDSHLMDLGITESLPPFEIIEDLHNTFFQVQYHFVPIIHPGRYFQAFYGSPLRKPPMCLQYAIWALASFGHEKYDRYQEVFYRRARQYVEADEMKGHGEHFITINHAQALALIATFEAKSLLFTRASMTSAKCVRLVQMMGLERLDGDPDEIPPSLGPALSWAEFEERRRVFWGAFAIDSHASISTGWPCLMNSDDVTTRLPASEAAFFSDQKEEAPFLDDVFRGASYTGFAGTLVICQIFKTILRHVHRSKPQDHPEDVMNGPFWTRHRDLDNRLLSMFMFLPENMRLPQNSKDPSATHTNLNLHASVICLHHAAVEKADKHHLPDSIKQTSIYRLKAAAEEIASILKLTSYSTNIFKSPLSALSLYCATTVYVYLAKQDPTNGLTAIDVANLELIIHAMEAIGRNHSITTAFLQQAYLDIQKNNLASSIRMPELNKYSNVFGGSCSNIPMLARSQVAKHTEASPVLPGRLPLGNPKGVIRPKPKYFLGEHPLYQKLTAPDNMTRHLLSNGCFQPVLGAIARNVGGGPPSKDLSHKRKRMSPSPGPGVLGVADELAMPSFNVPRHEAFDFGQSKIAKTSVADGILDPNWSSTRNVVLPDRTGSSLSSSPGMRGAGTETVSDGSYAPAAFGLGNTAEENRIDLRAFQDRISTPIWQSTEETFLAQLTETIVNDDPWGILTSELDWNASTSMHRK